MVFEGNKWFEENGTVIFAGRNMIKKMVVDGESVIVKRFKRPNFIQKIIYTFFRKTKAYRAYHNGVELEKRGVNTPRAIEFVETRRWGLTDYCYYITGEMNYPPLEDWTDRDDWDEEVAREFAGFAAELHEKGVLHWDLNDTNVRVRKENNGRISFSVIDINRMEFYAEGKVIPVKICMDNLTRFTGRMDLFEFVVREYAKARGMDEKSTLSLGVEIKEKHDRAWRRRKRVTGWFKKLF